MVRVSVVMGVYMNDAEGGRLLTETLDSILNQTFTDFEVVLVDDGSPKPIVISDPRVRVIRQEPNRGLTRALIEGCKAARGEYIARHDAGDLSYPTRLEKQVALLDANPGLAFVSCHTQLVGPEREPLYQHRGKTTEAVTILDPSAEQGVIDGPTAHGSVMFRRGAYERAGGYRAEFYYGQDWDLWYRLAEVGTFQIVPEVLYELRVMPEGISSVARGPQMQLAKLSLAAMRARAAGMSDAQILAAAQTIRKKATGRCARARGLYFIGESLRRNRDPRARRYFQRALQSCPLLPKPWVRLLQSLVLR